MSKNKNFTLNIPGADKEISLPFDKVEEWMMVMNHMDKSGISEDETRRIVIEEFLRFQREKEDGRSFKQKIHQSGDTNSILQGTDNVKPSARVMDYKKEKLPTSFQENVNPDIVVSKNSSAIPLSHTDFMNNSSKLTAQELEVKKICQNSRYPIFVSSDDIVTIYPSNLVEKFLKSQMNKKSNRDDSSLLLITVCVLGLGVGILYYLKAKGYYPTTTSAFT